VTIRLPCAIASVVRIYAALPHHNYCARAALATVADPLWTRDIELLTQRVQQRDPRLQACAESSSVHIQLDRYSARAVDRNLLPFDLDHGWSHYQRNRRRYAGNFEKFSSGKT
jgi:hypothetical protein